MKLVTFLALLISVRALCSEVHVNVSERLVSANNGKTKISLVMEITNKSKEPITLADLNGELIGWEIELWFLGKGIKLRGKTDAEWRREQAFVDWNLTKLMPGDTKKYGFELRDLLPDDPENDGFAKSLVEDVQHFKSGNGRVVVEYRKITGRPEVMLAQGSFEINEQSEKEK